MAAPPPKPKAVLFDLFETLVTHHDPHWTPPPQTIAQRLGLEEDTYRQLWRRYGKAWEGGEIASYQEALAMVCADAQKEPDAPLLSTLTAEYRLAYERPFEGIEPQIIEMMISIRNAGVKVGVVSNASDLDVAPWPKCGLAGLVDCLVVSHQVRLLKPDKRIYEMAYQRLETLPGETVFVGDGGSDELRGATEAGLNAYWCTWFLDRWPPGIRPNPFTGDTWRQQPNTEGPFPRLVKPSDLLQALGLA